MDISTPLFYDKIKSALTSAHTLQEVEEVIQNEVHTISGHQIGFVVGKVTPSEHETRESNLAILEKRTKEIAEKELPHNILVFSSSVIPLFIENSAKIDEFYIFWEQIVERYAEVLYTTPGYEASKGAINEIALAKKMRKLVKSYEEVTKE